MHRNLQLKLDEYLRGKVVYAWEAGVAPSDIIRVIKDRFNIVFTTATVLNLAISYFGDEYKIKKEQRRKMSSKLRSNKQLSTEIKNWIVNLVEQNHYSWKQILVMLRIANIEIKLSTIKSTYQREKNLDTFFTELFMEEKQSCHQ